MKKVILFALVLPFVFMLSGCFGDPVQDDLLNYVNKEMPKAFDLETKAVSAYDDVSGPNYTDDQTMYDALNNEIIPNYKAFVDELDAVKTETDEVRKVHEIYIKGAESQYRAFLKIKSALEQQDANMIEDANNLLSEARQHIRDYQNELNKLAKEHDVKLDKK